MVEPVSLKCKHNLCYMCLQGLENLPTLSCPLCRNPIQGYNNLQINKDLTTFI